MGAEISRPIAYIFDLSFSSDIFPSRLKTSRTIPIFKARDPSLCGNYCPISLLSTLSKIIEKIAAITLMNHLQLIKLLHPNQFGFQRDISTEHNLLIVFHFIGNSLNKGNFCIGKFSTHTHMKSFWESYINLASTILPLTGSKAIWAIALKKFKLMDTSLTCSISHAV